MTIIESVEGFDAGLTGGGKRGIYPDAAAVHSRNKLVSKSYIN